MRKTLETFVEAVLPGYQSMQMIAGDASFRKYYRVEQNGVSYIVMDAPPEQENTALFVQVATAFAQAGINVPEIIEDDVENGYLVLSDFGNQPLQDLLLAEPEQWLPKCMDKLFLLQTQGGQHLLELPEYDHMLLLRELSLFSEWFVDGLLSERLTMAEEVLINRLNHYLIESALGQPQVWVHRDYHCRNLMKVGKSAIGVIDFQDAVWGPITYDLVSILKDCYIRYPQSILDAQLQAYYIRLVGSDLYHQDFEQFERAFDLMGLQRHLKVLGIFSRLSLRDGKHHYLNDLPLVFDYVISVLEKYTELHPYRSMFERFGVCLADVLPSSE